MHIYLIRNAKRVGLRIAKRIDDERQRQRIGLLRMIEHQKKLSSLARLESFSALTFVCRQKTLWNETKIN